MPGRVPRDYWDDWGAVLLWYAALSGPLAWLAGQLLAYAVVKPACVGGNVLVLTAINAAAFAVTITGVYVSRLCLLRARGAAEDGGRPVDRSYFMAMVSLWLNAFAALLLVLATVPHVVLSPCE